MKNTKNATRPTKKLSNTLLELEDALNKWDAISKDVGGQVTKKTSVRDSELVNETKKLLSRLKIQLADLDR